MSDRPPTATAAMSTSHAARRGTKRNALMRMGRKGKALIGAKRHKSFALACDNLDAVLRRDFAGPRYAVLHGVREHAKVEEFVCAEARRNSIKDVRVESILYFDENVSVGYNVDHIVHRCVTSDQKGRSSNLFTGWLCRGGTGYTRVIHIPIYAGYDDHKRRETRMNLLNLIHKFEQTPDTRSYPPPSHAALVIFSCMGDVRDARTLRNQLRERSWGKPVIPLCRVASGKPLSMSEDTAVKYILSGNQKLAEETSRHLLANDFRRTRLVLSDTFSTLPNHVRPLIRPSEIKVPKNYELREMQMLCDAIEGVSAADVVHQGIGAWRGGASSDTREVASSLVTHLVGLRIRAEDNKDDDTDDEFAIPKSAVIGIEVRREALFRFINSNPSKELVKSFAHYKKGELKAKPGENESESPGSLPDGPPCQQYLPWFVR